MLFPDKFVWPQDPGVRTKNLPIIYWQSSVITLTHVTDSQVVTIITGWLRLSEGPHMITVITIPHYLSFWDKEESHRCSGSGSGLAPLATPRTARGESWVLQSHKPVVNMFNLLYDNKNINTTRCGLVLLGAIPLQLIRNLYKNELIKIMIMFRT